MSACQLGHHLFPSRMLSAAMETEREGAMGIWEGKHTGGVKVEILGTDGEDRTHERQRGPLGLFHSFKASCPGNGMNKGSAPALETFPKHLYGH